MSSFPADQTSNTSFYSQSDTVNVSDILGNVDFGSAQIRELAGLGTGKLGEIEFVQVDDVPVTAGPIASRGVLDDLCYGTGTTYLAGLSFGGLWGLVEGTRGPNSNFKLRINTVLNAVTRRGPFIGNSCGVLAMGYNGINGMITTIRGRHDAVNNIAAGALVGAIFKSTAGIRAMSVASVVCASAATAWTYAFRRLQ
ncbi:11066_t:CDS:2 [Paraglomus occultum]|uniref:11066_t:CDS:1 n=1 Tax=Paraglomus occultum TaxID=144539 RepID=A0A9N9C9J7_9GLOM|nr:11066_t:CDS:2 [Paraglomus occultum]